VPEFKLDRTAFKAQTAKEASSNNTYYMAMDWKQRLAIAAYLISVAYQFDLDKPPKLDRTKFSAKSYQS
jgi:hypothetical protein